MRVINKTNNLVIADEINIADKTYSRLIGLLNRSCLNEGEGLLIIPCKSIHSIGMRFTFDAVFLDKDNKVVFTLENMKPFKISPIVKNAYKVLELPVGTIKKSSISIGDFLDLS